ncbi:MAG: RNA-binding protein [Bradymonadales bacterium]
MSKKLFVGGLAWATTDEKLREVFAAFGELTDCKVVKDRETGRSRGFGFVSFADEESAKRAAEEMQGQAIDGRNIRVDTADDGPKAGRGGGGGRRRGPRNDNYGGADTSNYHDSAPRGGNYYDDGGASRADSRRGGGRRKNRDRYDDDNWS